MNAALQIALSSAISLLPIAISLIGAFLPAL